VLPSFLEYIVSFLQKGAGVRLLSIVILAFCPKASNSFFVRLIHYRKIKPGLTALARESRLRRSLFRPLCDAFFAFFLSPHADLESKCRIGKRIARAFFACYPFAEKTNRRIKPCLPYPDAPPP
jgi:hypothetical protein